jgi:hypothetical protein
VLKNGLVHVPSSKLELALSNLKSPTEEDQDKENESVERKADNRTRRPLQEKAMDAIKPKLEKHLHQSLALPKEPFLDRLTAESNATEREEEIIADASDNDAGEKTITPSMRIAVETPPVIREVKLADVTPSASQVPKPKALPRRKLHRLGLGNLF